MKSGIITIITGIALFLIGTCIIPAIFAIILVLGGLKELQFKVPGTAQATIEKPGRYYIWNNYETVYKGRSYSRSEKLPDGMEIRIKDSDGKLFDFVSDSSTSSNGMGSSKKSIGYIEAKSTGKVDIEVTGGNEERIFSFAQSGILKTLLTVFGIVVLFGFAGFGVTIWGIVKLVMALKKGG